MKTRTAGSLSARPDSTPRLDDADLVEALESSRRLGMLGAAPIADVIEHSSVFLAPLAAVSGTVVDLGSGGGVPGLVIAWMRPDLHVVLVDRRATRTDHLRRLVVRLRRHDQVEVLNAEAAALPRLLDRPADAIVARGFGSPSQVLKAALPALASSGIIVVSAPPDDVDTRWPAELLEAHDVRSLTTDPRLVVLARRR